MIPRRAQRRDANEASLVNDLKRIGVLWKQGPPLDGWAGYRGRWLPVEIKDPAKPLSARRLTDLEAEFFHDCSAYQLPAVLAHTAEDVIRAFGP